MKGKLVTQAPNNGGNQTDLLVCFPSRAHLALMPKAICSPSRPHEFPKRHHHRHTTKPTTTKRTTGSSRDRSSPLFKSKTRDAGPELDEPTSPKVTCAGQIKVRPSKPRSSNASSRPSAENKNWISVMEEIERIRKDGEEEVRQLVGGGRDKKDALQIFSSFHGLRFNMGCFGSFAGSIDCTSDEEEEDVGSRGTREEAANGSHDVFSKWFMLIEETQDIELKEDIVQNHEEEEEDEESEEKDEAVPPPNALLLMRCRSAPAKGLSNRAEELETEETRSANKEKEEEKEREKEKEKEKLVVMRCAPDFFKVSMDIAKETWVVGGEMDLLARSRSWKR